MSLSKAVVVVMMYVRLRMYLRCAFIAGIPEFSRVHLGRWHPSFPESTSGGGTRDIQSPPREVASETSRVHLGGGGGDTDPESTMGGGISMEGVLRVTCV